MGCVNKCDNAERFVRLSTKDNPTTAISLCGTCDLKFFFMESDYGVAQDGLRFPLHLAKDFPCPYDFPVALRNQVGNDIRDGFLPVDEAHGLPRHHGTPSDIPVHGGPV